MFQAGHCAGVSFLIASRNGAASNSRFNFLSKTLATSPSRFNSTRYRSFSRDDSVTLKPVAADGSRFNPEYTA